MNTISKTLGELLETMVRKANINEFKEYDGRFEKLKTDNNPLSSFGMSVEEIN